MKLLLVALFSSFAVLMVTAHQDQSQVNQEDRRKMEIQKLSTVLRDKRVRQESPEKLIEAIKRAGEWRVQEVIPELIALLDFKQYLPSEDPNASVIQEIRPLGPPDRYPAINALLQIGRPALQALTDVLVQKQPESIESENARRILRHIFRENPDEGVAYLTKLAVASSDATAKSRLEHAVKYLLEMSEFQKRVYQKK